MAHPIESNETKYYGVSSRKIIVHGIHRRELSSTFASLSQTAYSGHHWHIYYIPVWYGYENRKVLEKQSEDMETSVKEYSKAFDKFICSIDRAFSPPGPCS